MNYFTLIEDIKRTSLQFAEEFYEGDVYEFLNSGNHKYPSIILTTQNVSTTDNINSISGTLFCVDRLTDDSSNRLEIQSNAFNKLQRIISALEENTINLQSNTYTPFTEKFADLCGGMFVEFSFQYVGESICDDLEIKEIELTQNGVYDIIGYDRAIVNVRPVVNLEDITITDNGEYTCGEGFDGFGKVNVDLRGKVKVENIAFSIKNIDENGNLNGSELLDFSYIKGSNRWFNLGYNPPLKYIDSSTWNVGVSKLYDWTISYSFVSLLQLESLDVVSWDFERCTQFLQPFCVCPKLKTWIGGRTIEEVLSSDIKAFKNLKLNFITTDGANNTNSIDRASLRAAINGFADLSDTDSKTFGISQINFDKLTEEDVAILSAKNWTIAVK